MRTPKPTDDDLVCAVEGCAGVGGAIDDGCKCTVETSKRTAEVTVAN